jgi:hypothetical protein
MKRKGGRQRLLLLIGFIQLSLLLLSAALQSFRVVSDSLTTALVAANSLEAPFPVSALIKDNSTTNLMINRTKQLDCQAYRGILHIQQGDEFAAAGTLFFVYMINHILYAQQHNLLPFIHLEPRGVCWDANVHGKEKRVLQNGAQITAFVQPILLRGKEQVCGNPRRPKAYAGAPLWNKTVAQDWVVRGNGIWGSYFEQPFVNVESCWDQLNVVQIPFALVSPGMHKCAPNSVRPWVIDGMPRYMQPTNLTEWLHQMRLRAHDIVQQYYRPLPWLQKEIDATAPQKSNCLAIHYRATDKGHGRKKLSLEAFQPYAEVYSRLVPDGLVYLATDDAYVRERIRQEWNVTNVTHRSNTLKSSASEPVFVAHASQRHRLNTEALVEMYNLAHCRYLVHGYSAMTEAALYIRPNMTSINLDLPNEQHLSVEDFERLLINAPVLERFNV